MSFGGRLKEERLRLGFKQGEFAPMVGVDVQKQSLYETDKRELRADYLAAIAGAGVDVLYVLTGRHTSGQLAADETVMLNAYRLFSEAQREAISNLILTFSQS